MPTSNLLTHIKVTFRDSEGDLIPRSFDSHISFMCYLSNTSFSLIDYSVDYFSF